MNIDQLTINCWIADSTCNDAASLRHGLPRGQPLLVKWASRSFGQPIYRHDGVDPGGFPADLVSAMARRRPRPVGQSLRHAPPRRIRSEEPPPDASLANQRRPAVLTRPAKKAGLWPLSRRSRNPPIPASSSLHSPLNCRLTILVFPGINWTVQQQMEHHGSRVPIFRTVGWGRAQRRGKARRSLNTPTSTNDSARCRRK
jgi:hypothetical protein